MRLTIKFINDNYKIIINMLQVGRVMIQTVSTMFHLYSNGKGQGLTKMNTMKRLLAH